MKFEYYYNDVPGEGLSRNNLVYTSLISQDKKTFVQWFYNDEEYHKGQNEIVDPDKMEEKWLREVNYLTHMRNNFPDLVPTITKIDLDNRKIYLEVDGLDFWNRAKCNIENYNTVLPDWQDQMLEIIKAHKSLGLYKFSMHPSSYFIVDGKLKSINYFFCYRDLEGPISIADHASHIYSTRQKIMKEQIEKMGLSWDKKEPLDELQILCFESFRTNYPNSFIEQAKKIYDR
ncbi:MAG: hypothetical protein RLZZ196_307 [Bacteroidota bacterium]|jgi:hypothetical protein